MIIFGIAHMLLALAFIVMTDILKKKFQPIRNEIMSEFRKLCPKEL